MKTAAHACQKRLKYVATINDEALGEDTDADFGMRYVDIGNVDSSGGIHEVATYRFEDAPSRARRRVRDGDVIISTVRTYLQAIAHIQDPPNNLVVSTGFAVVRPRAQLFNTEFCKYALREPGFLTEVEKRSVGVSYPAINASDLGDIPVHLPPADQQRAIGQYLDRETARLDELVAAKERLLGLLAERRRAIITRAVTRGLDPHAPLRDSGIPWLGNIPAHWQAMHLKFACQSLQTGPFGAQLHAEDYIEGGIPVLNPAHLLGGRLVPDNKVTVSEANAKRLFIHRLVAGDIIFARRGELGRCAVVTASEAGWLCGTGCLRVRPRSDVIQAQYLFLTISQPSVGSWLSVESVGTTMDNLNSEILADIEIPVPPLSEQGQIVAEIEAETNKLDRLRAAAELSISLLKERRAALIAGGVTGQINIQEAAACRA